MLSAILAHEADFEGWRQAARRFLEAGAAPADALFSVGDRSDLFAEETPTPHTAARVTVPRRFLELAEAVVCHRDTARFALLYRVLWRLQREPKLLDVATDTDVRRLEELEKAVKRDCHKMTAFVRFRRVEADGRETFIAWFEPSHYTLERTAPFFMRRFTALNWAILTPYRSAMWDGTELSFGPGASKLEAPTDDDLEAYWLAYYASIFNPARLKVKAMTAEMPKKYWSNLPEAKLIPELVEGAMRRTANMIEAEPTVPAVRHTRRRVAAEEVVPSSETPKSLADAREAAAGCRRCPLWQNATQTVFGEGPEDAPVMFVGEQPGDQEDLAGRPFVGPAGQLFDRALAEAGLDRRKAYVTNAVKHFKFTPRGKRRLHQKPNGSEIEACRWWNDLERALVKPKLIVALGATAVQSLIGGKASITSLRERTHQMADGTEVAVTVHPSYLLRLPDEESKRREFDRFVDDLRRIGKLVPDLRTR